MKDVLDFTLNFVLTYGVRDRERFRKFVGGFLEDYAFDEETREKLVDILYEFCSGLGEHLRQTKMVKRAVQESMGGIEQKMDDLMARFEELSRQQDPDRYREQDQQSPINPS
jgi:hypothetical protein